ncbi:YkgJ family cysteine cluster protein [Thermodesulfobacteriota bacterium]
MSSNRKKVLDLALKELSWTDNAIQEFMSNESLPEPLDCRSGCHYCCYNLPVVTPPEALLLGHHVEQTFTDQEKKKIAGRINEILERIDGISPYEVAMMRHELPCIFLENAMCMVYEVRPAVCRACTSTSAAHCKMIFETRNHRGRLRCYQQIREIFQTVHSRLIDRCREMGCQADAFPLAEAVKDYFRHTEPIHAWLQGEIVFRMNI